MLDPKARNSHTTNRPTWTRPLRASDLDRFGDDEGERKCEAQREVPLKPNEHHRRRGDGDGSDQLHRTMRRDPAGEVTRHQHGEHSRQSRSGCNDGSDRRSDLQDHRDRWEGTRHRGARRSRTAQRDR